MKKCLIICGGTECDVRQCLECNNIENEYFVIACDKGYQYAQNQNIKCDLILGDFDSYIGKIPENARILPCEKDDTDTMYAVKTAVSKKFDFICITCACGGRYDHFIANIQSCIWAKNRGTECRIIDKNDIIFPVMNESIFIPKKEGFYISVYSFSPKCSGVYERGMKYSLSNAVLTNDNPLGTSNEWKDDTAELEIQSGTALVILSRM